MPLNVKKVNRVSKPGRYGDGHGLYLQVSPSGSKSWVFRYERNGKEFMLGLGALHTFSLDEARERARLVRQKLANGLDPLAANRAEKAAKALAVARQITFKDAAEQYFNQHEAKWKNRRHAAQFLSTLQLDAFPIIGDLAVADITTAEIVRVLDPIWKTKTETASRLRSRLEVVLSWATVRGYRSGDNPARWSRHLQEVFPARQTVAKTQHHAALPYAELPGFMAELSERSGIPARAVELTILTAARAGEVTGAMWSEFDLDKKVWTVPAERMKTGKEHRVPLSDRAVALLRALPREGETVFPGAKKGAPINDLTLRRVLRRMGIKPERSTVHGFRSTFRVWAAERSGYPADVIERALAHTVGNKVEAAYNRTDLLEKRARLMADWAAFAYGPIGTGTVTPIRAKAV